MIGTSIRGKGGGKHLFENKMQDIYQKNEGEHLRVSLRSSARTTPVDCGSDVEVVRTLLVVVLGETTGCVRRA